MENWHLFDTTNLVNDNGYLVAQVFFKDKIIVIADDNSGILKWLKYSLEDYGAIVKIFEHGRDVINFITIEKQEEICVFLLDLIMSDFGGIEVAKQVKVMIPNAKIIFVTGCSTESEEWLEASTLGVVTQKPIGIEELLRTIMQETANCQEQNV